MHPDDVACWISQKFHHVSLHCRRVDPCTVPRYGSSLRWDFAVKDCPSVAYVLVVRKGAWWSIGVTEKRRLGAKSNNANNLEVASVVSASPRRIQKMISWLISAILKMSRSSILWLIDLTLLTWNWSQQHSNGMHFHLGFLIYESQRS